jgi:hypothetical protein
VAPAITPHALLWEIPLADAYRYQAQRWLNDGIRLRKTNGKGKVNAKKYLRQ